MLLQPKFTFGSRVRVVGLSTDNWHAQALWRNNQWGTVRRVDPLQVPASIVSGEPIPPGWVFYTYTVVMDDDYRFAGLAEQYLEG